MTTRDEHGTETTIRPFRIDVPEEDLLDLRRRIAATRWPKRETVDDSAQGVRLATIQELARYWATDYDWRKCEAQLNALPQFMTEIDGLDIHFIHVRSPHEDALPLIITHGWPGSVIELLEVVGPLTDPTAYGGRAEDAFHLVLPSLPGCGFSGEPTEVDWDPGHIARAWAELMNRLGYTRYVAQGGDVGSAVIDAMGRQAPEGLLGIHMNLLVVALAVADQLPAESEKERAAFDAFAAVTKRGYLAEQGEHPQTIGYALADSPVALAAWMLDHDADSYEKISHAFLDENPSGGLTRDRVLDNITLYWLTNSVTSSTRLYWEGARVAALAAAHEVVSQNLATEGRGVEELVGQLTDVINSWPEDLNERFLVMFVENAAVAAIARYVYGAPPLQEADLRAYFEHSAAFLDSFVHR